MLFPPPANAPARAQAAAVWRPWLWFGFWTGMAGLSKYLGVFLPLGLFAFLALSPRHRHWILHPAPWAAALLAAAIIAPVLIWNGQNGWVSFAFQAGRALPVTEPSLVRLGVMALGQVAYLSPLIVPLLAVAIVRALAFTRAEDPARLLLWLALPCIVVMSCTPIWGNSGFPHWTMPGWFFAFALFGGWMARNAAPAGLPRPRVRLWAVLWAGTATAFTLALAVLFASVQSSDWLLRALPARMATQDPLVETLSWRPIRAAAALQSGPDWAPAFVLAQNWIDGGKVDLAIGGSLPVLVFDQDPRGFAFRAQPAAFVGQDAVIVVKATAAADVMAALRPYFDRLDAPEPLAFGRHGRAEVDLRLIRAHRLLRAYPLPYGPGHLARQS